MATIAGFEAGAYGVAHQLTDVFWRAGGGSGGGRSSGGGGGFSGGSSSSGGFSSGSSSIGAGGAAGALGALIFGGVCLFIIVIFVLIIMKSAKSAGGASAAGLAGQSFGAMGGSATGDALGGGGGARATSRADIDAGIAQIQARDPGFNEPDFLSDVNRAFFTIQQAWTERRPDISRQVMHDGIWNQHKFQIDQYLSLNKQNVLENLAIQNTRLVSVSTDPSFDTIVVRFFARCADYDIDLGSDKHKIIKGDRTEADWAEDWVFQRSSSAVTKPNAGTMNKKCPNCGAPLDLDLSGICKYCKAPVMSGEYDWVLTRIEQLPSYEMAQATCPA